MTLRESITSSVDHTNTPLTATLIKAKTRSDMKACLRDYQNMMQGKYESFWNNQEAIKLRKQIYEWEKLLYHEPNGTKHHRKFVRNYLIELESGFEENVKSKTWAKGMMQLTGKISDDMKRRSFRYRAQIRKIGNAPSVHKFFPPDISANIQDIIKNPEKKIDLSPLIGYLRSDEWKNLLMSNWYVNAYIGSIYFSILSETVNMEAVPQEIKHYQTLKWKINYSNMNKLIRERLLSIDPNPGKIVKVPELTKETYTSFLDTLEQNPELARSIFAARRYNGSNKTEKYERYGYWLREKDVYFIALWYTTTFSLLTDPNYRSGYCREEKTNS